MPADANQVGARALSAAGSPRTAPWDESPAIALPAHFAPQEHWAWSRIARGLAADLREFPSEGGAWWDAVSVDRDIPAVMDPWRPHSEGAPQWSPEDKQMPLLARRQAEGWTPAEAIDGDLAEPPPARWPSWQTLSPDFLRTILVFAPWSEARAKPWVMIRGARFAQGVELNSDDIVGELGLFKCRIEQKCDLMGLKVERELTFSGSCIATAMDADRLDVGFSLFLDDGCRVQGELRLISARISKNVYFDRSVFTSGISADGIIVGGNLNLAEGAHVTGDVRLPAAKVEADVVCVGSVIAGALLADGAVIGGNLILGGGARVLGPFDGVGLTLGGALSLRNAGEIHHANLIRAKFSRGADLSGARLLGAVDFSGANLGDELTLAHGAGDEPRWGQHAFLNLRNAKVWALQGSIESWRRRNDDGRPIARDVISRDLTAFAYECLGGLAASQGQSLADATPRQLRGWLRAAHGRVLGVFHAPSRLFRSLAIALNLDEQQQAAMEGELARLARIEQLVITPSELSSAASMIVSAETPAQPTPEQLRVMKRVGSALRNAGRKARQRRRLLFTPSPYLHLADALQREGREEKARKVLVALGAHERQCVSWLNPRKYFLALSHAFIGHGYRTAWALGWFAALVMAFVLAGLSIQVAHGGAATASWELSDWSGAIGHWILAGLDNAVPGLGLGYGTPEVLVERLGAERHAQAHWLLALHRLMGIVILGFAVAGVTGWARRRSGD